jgi:hypothetical protein
MCKTLGSIFSRRRRRRSRKRRRGEKEEKEEEEEKEGRRKEGKRERKERKEERERKGEGKKVRKKERKEKKERRQILSAISSDVASAPFPGSSLAEAVIKQRTHGSSMSLGFSCDFHSFSFLIVWFLGVLF